MATYQSVTEGDVIVVAPHLDRARASLKAAETLRDGGLSADAATRAHQAAVHAERALLATEKRSPQTIRDVHRLATLHFLHNDQLDRGYAETIDRLGTLRQRADDLPDGTVPAEDAAWACEAAGSFLAEVEEFLGAQGYA
jgi:uncharacterized protein (UPF0332 family)